MENVLAKYQSDHLILLVGGNPLPNAVAAQLLAASKANIWLLHSGGDRDGEASTKSVAENLEIYLRGKNKGWTIYLEPIPSADNIGIKNRVQEIVKQRKLNGRIGLHYTGGTKSMSIHTYRELEHLLSNNNPRPIFSYLDPRRLALRVDGHGTESSQLIPLIKNDLLRQQLAMTPDELGQLHGYERATANSNWATPEDTPGLLDLCREIAQVNGTDKGFAAWHKWVYKEQHRELPTSAKNPGLESVTAAFNKLCGIAQATPDELAAKLLPTKPNARLTSCQAWFRGEWLEEYVLWSVRRTKNSFISFSQKGFNYKVADDFQLDVVVMISYQLFVFSCITTADKDRAKEHLLEAYVRARQLGGDEARVALVCCYDDALRLQNEVSRVWDAEGKVKVFGMRELKNLTQHLADWFQQQTNL